MRSAGPLGRAAGPSAADGVSIAVGRAGVSWFCFSEAAGGDVAVGGGGADVELGGAVVLQGVADAAGGGAGVQGGRDAGGGADGDVAGLGGQLDRAAHGLGDLDV